MFGVILMLGGVGKVFLCNDIYSTAWLKLVWRLHVLKHNGWLAQYSTLCVDAE